MKKQPNPKKSARAKKLAEPAPESNADAGPREMVVIEHRKSLGSSGTEIYAGYLAEEYLTSLRGTQRADTFDKMARSDYQVQMLLAAVKNPIKSATWEVEEGEDTDEAKKIARHVQHVLFQDTEVPGPQFIDEALTAVEQGYSVFERTHYPVLDDSEFGSYVGLRFNYRSQRTIERFNIDKQKRTLASISQYAYGDDEALVDIPAEHLLIVTLNRRGLNYEGISLIRACYGNWLRKNADLKLNAIGSEKYAIMTPLLKVPSGKETSKEYTNAVAALEAWISHEKQYITLPAGWDLELQGNEYDPEKLDKKVDAEDRRMTKAFLANFLELGMSGSGGAYALGQDLSDFFLGGLQHIAEQISTPINVRFIPEFVRLNYGPQARYPKLKVSGISDKAGKELAEIMKSLKDGGILTPDDRLEAHARKRFGLPEADPTTARKSAPVQIGPDGRPLPPTPQAPGGKPAGQESEDENAEDDTGDEPAQGERRRPSASTKVDEKKLSERLLLAERAARAQIREGKGELHDVMTNGMRVLAEKRIRTLMRDGAIRQGFESSGLAAYRSELERVLGGISMRALTQARREVPKARGVKLAEEGIRLADFDDLPAGIRAKLKKRAAALADTQAADLEKVLKFQFMSSDGSTDSKAIMEHDLASAAEDFIAGAALITGAANTSAHVVNETRSAFFSEPAVLDEIEGFAFVNGDPQAAVCRELAGKVFAKNDPESARLIPPLHHNCESYIVPVLIGEMGSRTFEGLKPSAEAQASITLTEPVA